MSEHLHWESTVQPWAHGDHDIRHTYRGLTIHLRFWSEDLSFLNPLNLSTMKVRVLLFLSMRMRKLRLWVDKRHAQVDLSAKARIWVQVLAFPSPLHCAGLLDSCWDGRNGHDCNSGQEPVPSKSSLCHALHSALLPCKLFVLLNVSSALNYSFELPSLCWSLRELSDISRLNTWHLHCKTADRTQCLLGDIPILISNMHIWMCCFGLQRQRKIVKEYIEKASDRWSSDKYLE